MNQFKYTRFFEEIGIDDVPLVGGKNASLGEMYRKLSAAGVRVPNGFAITADAYRHVLEGAHANDALRAVLDSMGSIRPTSAIWRAGRSAPGRSCMAQVCPKISRARFSRAIGVSRASTATK